MQTKLSPRVRFEVKAYSGNPPHPDQSQSALQVRASLVRLASSSPGKHSRVFAYSPAPEVFRISCDCFLPGRSLFACDVSESDDPLSHLTTSSSSSSCLNSWSEGGAGSPSTSTSPFLRSRSGKEAGGAVQTLKRHLQNCFSDNVNMNAGVYDLKYNSPRELRPIDKRQVVANLLLSITWPTWSSTLLDGSP